MYCSVGSQELSRRIPTEHFAQTSVLDYHADRQTFETTHSTTQSTHEIPGAQSYESHL